MKTFEPAASLVLFGHDPEPARVVVFERSRGWRVRRAILFAAAGMTVAPFVALLPPHAPWALGALACGGFFAWRSLKSRFAVAELEARCPRCEAPVAVPAGSRLRQPHSIHCQACHHELVLRVDEAALPSI